MASFWEGFWRPRWRKVRSKSLRKSIFKSMIKKIAFEIALGTDFSGFGAPLGTKMEPKTFIFEPRSAQDPQTWSQDGPRTSNLQPRWHQIAIGQLHGTIFIDFGPHFGRFLIDFEGFCNPAGLIWASIMLPLCIHSCLPIQPQVPNVEGQR